VPYKDVVFGQLSFTLKKGTISLRSTRALSAGVLFELEYNDMKAEFETRPRTKSYKFGLSLGAMYLPDKITPNSVFPLLISPQGVQGAPLYSKTPSFRSGGGGGFGSSWAKSRKIEIKTIFEKNSIIEKYIMKINYVLFSLSS